MIEILYRPTNQIGYFLPKTDFWIILGLAILLGWTITYSYLKLFANGLNDGKEK